MLAGGTHDRGRKGRGWYTDSRQRLTLAPRRSPRCALSSPRFQSIRLLDESSFQAFMDEAKLQRSLRHRNVVLFYGVGVFEDDSPFLITEFMAKGSLRDVRWSLCCFARCVMRGRVEEGKGRENAAWAPCRCVLLSPHAPLPPLPHTPVCACLWPLSHVSPSPAAHRPPALPCPAPPLPHTPVCACLWPPSPCLTFPRRSPPACPALSRSPIPAAAGQRGSSMGTARGLCQGRRQRPRLSPQPHPAAHASRH